MPDEAADADALLAQVLAGSGLQLDRARLCQVEPDAAGSVVRGYEVAWHGATGAGTDVLYLQPVGDGPQDAGLLVVQDPASGRRHRVWRYPDDPALPALPAVVHADAAAVVLARLGLPGGEPDLELVSYRPGRRAVVRAVVRERTTYLKVVRPERASLVHAKHQRLHDAGLPVPPPLGWSPSGVLALPAAPGVPATDVLPALVSDEQFVRALAALQVALARAVDPAWRPRRTPTIAVRWYAEQLAQVAPVLADRARGVASAVTAAVPDPATTPGGIHGDLHLGQLLVDPGNPGRLTGLLDVDTAGPGDPDEDATALLAHLEVLALTGDKAADHAVTRWPQLLLRTVATAAVRRAAHLLAYALDPAGQGDLDHADKLVARAEAHLS